MSIIPDTQILDLLRRKAIVVEPWEPKNLAPASVDLTLGQILLARRRNFWQRLFPSLFSLPVVTFNVEKHGRISVKGRDSCNEAFDCTDGYVLYPGDFVLAHTKEIVGTSSLAHLAELVDKSTLARLGLSICFSSGYIDPGNVLRPTLEIKNNGHEPIELIAGMHICQVKFQRLDWPCSRPYSGKYQNDRVVQDAK